MYLSIVNVKNSSLPLSKCDIYVDNEMLEILELLQDYSEAKNSCDSCKKQLLKLISGDSE